MIAKVGKGDDFSGLARYLTRNGRGEVLDMRHLASADPQDAAREMQVAAAVSTRCRKPVMHVTVSYAPADKVPSDADMRADATEVLTALGLAENQAFVIKHGDCDHAHFHITANRIGSDGKAVSDSRSYSRTEAALRKIEVRRGLSVTLGRHAASPKTGQRMTGSRTAVDPRQNSASQSVRQTLLKAQSWGDLHSGLKREGWTLEIARKGKRPAGAVLIGPDGRRIAAGKIDRGATLSRLRDRMGPEGADQHCSPVSATADVKLAALEKRHRTQKQKTDHRKKAVVRVGAKTATHLIGVVKKITGPRGCLISAARKSTADLALTRKRPRTPRLQH